MDFLKRPLAITDIETTGLDAQLHEMLEIAVLIVDQKTLKIKDSFESKIKPRKLLRASRKALRVSGYNFKDWLYAPDLTEVMKKYARITKHAVFMSYNVFWTWAFLDQAFKTAGIEDYTDYHRVDLFSIAWSDPRRWKKIQHFSLDELCKYFGVPLEPKPHAAIEGAKTQLALLKKMIDQE